MFWGQEDNFLLRGIVMEKWAGLGIILLDIIAMAVLYIHINRKGVYKGDFIGLVLDSWEIIGLFIALLLLGLVMILK